MDGHDRMSRYKTTFARIHRRLNAYGFNYADPSWVKEATIGMIYQMGLEFKKLIEDPRVEDLSWKEPEWIFVYQEEVSVLGMLSTPVEYCLARVLSSDLVTLKAGDHIIALTSDELRHPSLIDPALAKNRKRPRRGQRFCFKIEGEVKNRKGSLKKVTWAFVITFLTPLWERNNGKIFYFARAVLQSGRSNPSSWTVEDREKHWNKLLAQILSYMPPVEEKQMILPIPGVIPEPKIKIPEMILEPGFKKILENQSRSYAKSLAPGMFGI
jgi:hypothetical protein